MAEKIDFTEIAVAGYSSDFESDVELEANKRKEQYESLLPKKRRKEGLPDHQEMGEQYNKEEGKILRLHYLTMDAYDRHKQFVNNYILYFGGSLKEFTRDSSKDKTDLDIIRENHRFLWTEEDESDKSWEKRLAKKYYDKLFKEYCLADLSRYKENKIGMRWRTEKEVIDGKGQFVCGNKKCSEKEGLRSWEVNFAYVEHGERKNALVKLRLCPDCSYQLNYRHKRKEILLPKKTDEQPRKHKAQTVHNKNSKEHQEKVENSEVSSVPSVEKNSTDTASDSSLWSGPVKLVEEKSREEEFDDYFADMFL